MAAGWQAWQDSWQAACGLVKACTQPVPCTCRPPATAPNSRVHRADVRDAHRGGRQQRGRHALAQRQRAGWHVLGDQSGARSVRSRWEWAALCLCPACRLGQQTPFNDALCLSLPPCRGQASHRCGATRRLQQRCEAGRQPPLSSARSGGRPCIPAHMTLTFLVQPCSLCWEGCECRSKTGAERLR